jgi:hypothetical protein
MLKKYVSIVFLSDEELKPGVEYGDKMHSMCKGRTFFSTKAGRVGLGPPDAQSGDKVCVIYNAYTPFILRKRQEKVDRVQLVGEVYVDGLMYGQAFAADERKGDEIFVID